MSVIQNEIWDDFHQLTPEIILDAVEKATGSPLTGFISSLPSYINRVYELMAKDETRLIVKFYRPHRWTFDALKDEHDFILSCALGEIPVVSPLRLQNDQTLDCVRGIYFAVFPKRSGREFEIVEDEDYRRIGRLIARIHLVGGEKKSRARIRLHPLISTASDLRQLMDGGYIPKEIQPQFGEIRDQFVDLCADLFEGIEFIRIHGDCHLKNILYRPDEGLMIIDFDDMMEGPPIHDMWLVLPAHAARAQREIALLLEGYEQFRSFDYALLRLIEPLRMMRIIYFLAWCSRQSDDYQFRKYFPNWGEDTFWKKEMNDLTQQLGVIKDTLQKW